MGTRLTWLTYITKHRASVCMDSSSTEIWQSLSCTELYSNSQDSLPSGHVASTGLVANRTAKLGDIGRGSSLRISGSNSHNHISIDSHSNLNQHQIYGMKRTKLYRYQHSTIIINIWCLITHDKLLYKQQFAWHQHDITTEAGALSCPAALHSSQHSRWHNWSWALRWGSRRPRFARRPNRLTRLTCHMKGI